MKATPYTPDDWNARAKSETPSDTDDGLQSGDPIPGSKFFRTFCPRCKTPMRSAVVIEKDKGGVYCEKCAPRNVGVGSPRSAKIEDNNDRGIRMIEDGPSN